MSPLDELEKRLESLTRAETDPRELWQIEEVRVWFGRCVRFTPATFISCPKGPFNSISLFMKAAAAADSSPDLSPFDKRLVSLMTRSRC